MGADYERELLQTPRDLPTPRHLGTRTARRRSGLLASTRAKT